MPPQPVNVTSRTSGRRSSSPATRNVCSRPTKDVSGDAFRHGERVARGERGVWDRPFGPGKYPFNTYAGQMILVPTTNFVLHWITGKTESHQYDDSLSSIDLVTKDAYEPMLPLSVVVHIDYMKAPSVIQRFGDVKKLITQTLDPMLSAFFRDAVLPVLTPLAPYVYALSSQAPDRKWLREVALALGNEAPPSLANTKRAWFTDTLEDVNGVANTIRRLTAACRDEGHELVVVTSRSEITITDAPGLGIKHIRGLEPLAA